METQRSVSLMGPNMKKLNECYDICFTSTPMRFSRDVKLKTEYCEVFEAVKKDAEDGFTLAQYWLGWMYGNGRGVALDVEKAFYWNHLALEQGYSDAAFREGTMYEHGYTTDGQTDDYKAFEAYAKGVELGSPICMFCLAGYYIDGRFVKQDAVKNFYLVSSAAILGDPNGQKMLGYYYANGFVVDKNDEQAIYWYKKAVETFGELCYKESMIDEVIQRINELER